MQDPRRTWLHVAEHVTIPTVPAGSDTMPSRIKMESAMDALYNVFTDRDTVRLTKNEFFDIMRGQGVASSKEALRTLWARSRFASWNVYNGQMEDIIIVNVPALAHELREGGVYTYTYTHSTEGVQE